jgi:exopolysaccharide production protein ExoQ
MSVEARAELPSSVMGNRQKRPAGAAQSAASSLPARMLFTFFIIFNFPAFTLQLALDMNTGRWTGSPVLQVVTIGSELFVFAVILSSSRMMRFVLRCWPVLVLVSLAFISATWSRNRAATIHEGNTYMTTVLLGLALVGALPGFHCIRTAIRAMVLGCMLSIAWVVVFPEAGIHQLTDVNQSVHAGLWRGIFSHKQGLGYFAGVTTGLLLFYRTMIFPLPLLLVALACSLACLIGTQSATGMVTVVIMPAVLYSCHFMTRFPPAARKVIFFKFALGCVAIAIAYRLGVLNFVIVQVLGKSTDLTGRADFWPIILENFNNSGASVLGGGFGAGLAVDMSEWSVDNGYIDKLIEFGYLLSPIIFVTFGVILWLGIRLILTTSSEAAAVAIFPFSIWSVILIANITESNFMTKCWGTVLTSIAVGIIVQQRQASSKAVLRQAGNEMTARKREIRFPAGSSSKFANGIRGG